MRWRGVLALLLVALTPLAAAVATTHAHDSLRPGLYNARCPLQELAGHGVAMTLAAPAAAPLAVVPSTPPAFVDLPAIAVTPLVAAPRAPPAR